MKTLFANALVVDGLGSHRERSAVLVEDDHISAVGQSALERRAEVDRTVDLAGKTLMPGMIDCHAHPAGGDFYPEHDKESYGLAMLQTARALQRTLYAGFTTLRSAGACGYLNIGYMDVEAREAIRRGVIAGPRLLAAGGGVTMTGGHEHLHAAEVDGADSVRAEVRRQLKRGVDAVKVFASGGIGTPAQSPHTAFFTPEEIAAAVVEARRAGKPTLTHAMGNQSVRNCIAAGVTSIDHGNFLDEECCQLMAEKGIYYVPTFSCYWYYHAKRLAEPEKCARADAVIAPHRESFQMALRAGVKIALASDCGLNSRMPNGENALEFWLYVQSGMSPEQAIVAGTSSTAKLLGLDHLIGSVEAGKLADLIVVDGNPLDDISTLQHKVALVMKGGAIVRNDLDGGSADRRGMLL